MDINLDVNAGNVVIWVLKFCAFLFLTSKSTLKSFIALFLSFNSLLINYVSLSLCLSSFLSPSP